MVSLGYPDGEEIQFGEFAAAVARIAKVLGLPLSADIVAGFGATPDNVASTVRAIVRAGAIGVNIEDFVHATKKLISVEQQVQKLRAARRMGESMKVPVVINARTDAFRFAEGDADARLKEAITRCLAYKDAGVDCVYPMGLVDSGSISKVVQALNFPVNVMVRKGLPTIRELEQIGVARVSFGPSASYATMGLLKRISNEVLEKGTFNNLVDGAISFDELNSLAVPRP